MSEKWTNVPCSSCGKEKPTNPTAYRKRVEKFGGEEEMKANWKCRECSKSEKAGNQEEVEVTPEE